MHRTHRDPAHITSSVDVDSLNVNNQLMLEFDTHGAIEFKMDERTYRMIPLANSEDYMYRKHSLLKAKQVSLLYCEQSVLGNEHKCFCFNTSFFQCLHFVTRQLLKIMLQWCPCVIYRSIHGYLQGRSHSSTSGTQTGAVLMLHQTYKGLVMTGY